MDALTSKPALAAAALAFLWILESAIPMFEGRQSRVRHDAANLLLGLANAALAAIVFAGATLFVTQAAAVRGVGLLHLLDAGSWVEIVLAFLLIDLWQYLWHRLNHRVRFLWRFHAVHHADPDLDASTALRFHTLEIAFSSTVRLAVLPLLGVTIGQLLVYETILLPVILLHHSNVRLPAALDAALRLLIVTPRMHWVHHSDFRPETDSNYASVFSGWDRLLGTFRLRDDPRTLRLGLRGVRAEEERGLWGMLLMPFRARPPADDSDD
jgi:sterol desaturase/sphingolipid hydroxylase (fatty acid hydroxylase superfamily)